MQSLFLMRYSFFGRSDWRSDASRTADLLFDPARLEKRAVLLEQIALRSLSDQTDGDFGLIVLSSEGMPAPFRTRLAALCKDTLGDRAHVLFEAPERAAYCIDQFRRRSLTATGPHVIQSILDDDDAVGAGFVETIKREAAAAVSLFHAGQTYTFISHAKGVNLVFRPDGGIELRRRNMPAAAQGLTLVSKSGTTRSPFNIAHKKILERRPVRVIHGGPVMYLRSVHDTNDSRAMVGGKLVSEADIDRIIAQDLPLLGQFRDRLVLEKDATD